MRTLFKISIFLFCFGLNQSNAQTFTLAVGNSVRIGNCKNGAQNFEYIDEYARTLPLDTSGINKETGEGFLNAFFNDKSIDAHRLPCLHAGKKYKIAAFHTFEVEDPKDKSKKIEQQVMLLYSGFPQTLFWVMVEDAFASGEVIGLKD